ncbi:hypothetical protein Rhopal_006877-T1 [Rhodotorula paludigena]|uniref:Uncharacterized protein n=1 Tax=Rhodotorula paludigena TaxID=86838 RepID=A0AAV5GTG9_9BASI|nr:hypothetical protein Rhopal_006877-T1 [Rhodotorula paludigena]
MYGDTKKGANEPDFASPGETEFHVLHDHKLKKHAYVTGSNSDERLYFMHFPTKWTSTKWRASFRQGGEDGPELYALISDGGYARNAFDVVATDGRTTSCNRVSSTWETSHKWQFESALSGASYTWQSKLHWTGSSEIILYHSEDMSLSRKERRVVAVWKRNAYNMKKSGVLTIEPEYLGERELIIVTGIGVNERIKEVNNNNAAISSSSGAAAAAAASAAS